MFPILYKKDETNFTHNGLGVVSGAVSVVPEEELNGLFEITIKYDSEGFLADKIENGMIVKAKANDKQDLQLFRIYAINKSMQNDNLIINAQHITYDLAGNFVETFSITDGTTKEAMETLQGNLAYPTRFNITSSNNTTVSSTTLHRTNPLQMIAGMDGSILDNWGGQIERDNFHLILHARRGSDDGVLVTYKKNLTGLEATFDDSKVVTRIFPFKYDEETDTLITIDDKYIDSPNIHKYPVIKILPIDFSHDENIQNKTDLYNASKDYFKTGSKDLPTVEMEVEFEPLWHTEEYKDVAALELVGMGDTITVRHSKMGIDVKAQVVKVEYDSIAEKNKKVSLGNVKARLTDKVNQANDLVHTIGERINNANEKANEAIRAANGKNTIYYGPDEPTNPQKEDIWFKTVDGEYTRTYRFDGLQWQLVVSADIRDIEEEAQEARNRADEAVEKANLATNNANEAIEQAQGAFDEASEAHTIADGAKELADATQELAQTIKNNVDGHSVQIEENEKEISRKMNTIDANAKFATQSQLTQTSSSLTSQITKVQSNLDNLSYENRNLAPISKIGKWGTDGFNRNDYQFTLSGMRSGLYIQEDRYEPNTEYVMSFKVKKISGSVHAIAGHSNVADSSKTKVYRDGVLVRDGNWSIGDQKYPNDNGEYDYTIKFTTRSSIGTPNDRMYIQPNRSEYDQEYTVVIWDLQLEKGNKKTPWQPAPEDVTTVVQFSKLEQTVDSISAQVIKKVDKTLYDSFVQQTEKSLSSKVSQGRYDDDMQLIGEEFSSIIQTVQGVQTQVNDNKGNISTVTQLANTLRSRMTNAEGNINTLTQTASSLQSTIEGIGSPGQNLVINGGFENKHFGWTEIGQIVNDGYSGNHCLRFMSSNSTQSKKLNQPIIVVPGRKYEVSYWYRTSSDANGVSGNQKLRFGKKDGSLIAAFGWNGAQTSWKKHSRIWTAPSDVREVIVTIVANHTSGWVRWDDISIVDVTEHEQTQSQISQLSDAINLRVKKGDVINQINLDTSGILIQGKNLTLDGNTTVTGTFKVNNANITSVDAGKMTTGTLDAGKVSVINLNASYIKTGKLNANAVTISATNGNAKLDLKSTGLHSYDSNGRLRITLNIRSAGGAGSDPATLRFFSGKGSSYSAGIGMNVNNTFVIGSSSSQVAMELRSGKNAIYYADQHRFVTNGSNKRYWKLWSTSDNPVIEPDISGRGWIGSSNYRVWQVYTNRLYYVSQHKLSTRDRKENIRDLTPEFAQQVFDQIHIKKYRYLDEDGQTVLGEENYGPIAEESPNEILSDEGDSLIQDNYINIIAGALKNQQKRINQLESTVEKLIIKFANKEVI